MTRSGLAIVAGLAGLLSLAGCGPAEESASHQPEIGNETPGSAAASAAGYHLPRGLEGADLIVPEDNLLSPAKIRLGEQLFFDQRLSGTGEMSCQSCHYPEQGWVDGRRFSPKVDGKLNSRNTPTPLGAGFYPELYWDGRAQGLEAQVLAAWKGQMGGDPEAVASILEGIPSYREQFQQAFGAAPTGKSVVQALSSFVRTLNAGDTPWDRHPQDEASLAASEVGRGFKIFSEVARCALCHAPPVFSDLGFHNVGIGFDGASPDPGRSRYLASAAEKAGEAPPPEAETLTGAFKTPSLRGVALTAPYFHDGSVGTLEEAVDLMLGGGIANAHLDEKLKPAPLTPQQRQELLAFLRALTPDVTYTPPPLP